MILKGIYRVIGGSKDEDKNIVTVIDSEKPGFKASYLDYRAIASKDGMTLAVAERKPLIADWGGS